MNNQAQLYMNKAQIRAMLVRAHIEIDIWGRGTGKSEGVIAERIVHNTFAMPRSKGILIAPTYMHALVNVLPNVLEMWKRMGYHRDLHYFIGRKPPASWNWPTPLNNPLSPKHAIFWFNGSCQVIVSQDRAFNAAGPSVDYIIGDEAKHLNYDKLSETFQTNRGNRQFFGDRSEHHSIVFTTDMPNSPKAKWLFDYEQHMDEKAVELVLGIQSELIDLHARIFSVGPSRRLKIQSRINKLNKALNAIRKDLTYFSVCSSLENIDVLGLDYIKEQKRTLTPQKFDMSILGKRLKKIEGGFYAALDENEHYYVNPNYELIDSLSFDFNSIRNRDCRMDDDLLADQPLDIGMDYNAAINSMVVGQQQGDDYAIVNFLFVKSPDLLDAVVKKFCNYYKHYKTKVVNYYYNHTAVGRDAARDYAFCDKVMEILSSKGWSVNDQYTGRAPGHDTLFNDINNALKGNTPAPRVRINSINCADLIVSLENAGVRQGRSGFEKDKSSEKSTIIPPEHATHPSEAFDTLYWARHMDMFDSAGHDFIPNEII
jgi:hypothetical protein